MPSGDAWTGPLDAVLSDLGTSPAGLSGEAVAERLERDGLNLVAPGRARRWRGVATQFLSPISILLLVAAVLSMALGEPADGSIILGILLVSGALGYWQERRATDTVERLLALIQVRATVLRDGIVREIPVEQVVAGDIVQLSAGASVPADVRLLESNSLFVDQSALTGESFPAAKEAGERSGGAPRAERDNALYLGTHVVSGTGTAVVVRTGVATEFGRLAGRLGRAPAPTEFERGVRHFGHLLLQVASAMALIIFAINVALDRPVLDALLFTLALTVGLTPQLLPAIMTVTLSRGARHMADQRVIVRRLTAIEDLGGMEILCTDKTGTITTGSVATSEVIDWSGQPSARARLLAGLNARWQSGFPNPIDTALRESAPPDEGWEKLGEVPYDFVRKRLTVVLAHEGETQLVTKGAVPSVLGCCESAENVDGTVVPIAEARQSILDRFDELTGQGRRCLAVACRAIAPGATVDRDSEQGLTFVGLLGFADPLKPDATASLAALGQLGIRMKLITGDSARVAQRVAADVGLGAGELITGADLREMTEAALTRAAPEATVFAEIEPNQKERIIRALRSAGFAVGFLGDGINDAAALRAADVGISVDTAADVTRQAADIVLLEKDLGVLSRGVAEGRRAFANTLKYIYITTSANFGNMFSMAVASLVAAFLPLLPKQILLINVLTDLPAMALATDQPDPEQLERPRRWDNRTIRRAMLVFGLTSSAFDFLTFAVLLWLRVQPVTFRTAWFTESVLSELVVLMVIRTRRFFLRSRVGGLLLATSLAVAGVTIVLPWSPPGRLLGFASMGAGMIGLVAAIVVLYAVASDAAKRLVRQER